MYVELPVHIVMQLRFTFQFILTYNNKIVMVNFLFLVPATIVDGEHGRWT
jgi:hypothetical protein